METLSDRLKWILQVRQKSARGLSLDAGLSQSHVGQIIRGTIKGEVSVTVLAAIAKASDVELRWLMTGEGNPPGDDAPAPAAAQPPAPAKPADSAPESRPVKDPRYENLETVIRFRLRENPGRWSTKALDAVRSIRLEADEDPSNAEWERRLDAFESTLRRLAAGESFGTLVDEEETAQPWGKRRR